jgi:NhaA family Na+:H+ antiporter
MPKGADMRQLYGVALLTGIGFTMSLFIDGLAFDDGKIFSYADRLAIIAGSLMSGVAGYLVLLKTKGSGHSDTLSD